MNFIDTSVNINGFSDGSGHIINKSFLLATFAVNENMISLFVRGIARKKQRKPFKTFVSILCGHLVKSIFEVVSCLEAKDLETS